MAHDLFQRLDAGAKALVPALLSSFLIILTLVPLRAPEVAPLMPALGLTAVYYWAVFRPDLLPAWLVFLLGLLQDLLMGAPLGVGVVSLVSMHFFVAAQRKVFVSPTFAMLWVFFGLFAAASLLLSWLLGSLLLGQMLDLRLLFLHYALTVGAYPCLAWLFGKVQQLLL